MPQFKSLKNSIIRSSAYLLICTLAYSCAQVVAPGGGKKDTTPPRVVSYSPDSASLNFKSKNILITFDEFVTLKDLNTQLIISPPLAKTPDVTAQKKTLSIVFDKDEILKPNTTYCISFGNAVQDLNENNPKENFKYIFSTGDFIDSLTLKGRVQNGFNLSTEKGILVLLYSDYSDSAVYKGQPDYFAKTDADGNFQINNIKAGKYKLAAIKDANNNYKYDGESEQIGFVDSLIDISKKNTILINLFQEPSKKVYLKKRTHDSYGKVTLVFSQGSDSIKVNPLSDMKDVQTFSQFSKNKDTLVYWLKNFLKDSLILQVKNGNKILDTVGFKFIKMEDALKSRRNPLKLQLVSSPNGNQGFDLNSNFILKFSDPISSINKDARVQLKEDTIISPKKFNGLAYYLAFESDPLVHIFDTTVSVEDPDNPGTFIAAPIKFKENTKYHLLILPGTVTDIFGLKNDSLVIDFKTKEEKYYGTVKLTITVPEAKGQYIIQLLDEGGNLVRENVIVKSKVLNYGYLYPKKYKLKLIYDDNNNGKWDTGNYLQHTQPEKVIYNSELINIRSNWDAELNWAITNNK
ncbi:MAG: Ig-like domain-containing protein [Bacteroidia bacterium]